MAKKTLTDIGSGIGTSVQINNNFQSIEDDLNDKVLYRDNPSGEPNQMENELDMNSNRVINLPSPVNDNEPARWIDVKNGVVGLTDTIPSQSGNAKTPLTTTGSALAWSNIDSDHVDYDQGDVGSVTRTLLTRLQDTKSVKDFGAVGDGATDDRAAFNSASSGFVIPAGTYKISSNVTISDVIFLPGASIKPDSGITVTITGSVFSMDEVVFDGSASGVFDLTDVSSTLRLTQFSGTYANDKIDNATAWFMGSGQGNSYSFEVPRPDPNYDATAVQTKNGREYWICDSTLHLTNNWSEGTVYLHGAFFGLTDVGANPLVRIGDASKLNNLTIIGDLVAHSDSAGTVTDCVFIDAVARLSIPGTINTQYGDYGTTIGGPNMANNSGAISIGHLHTFGYKYQGHRIAGGGIYSLSNVVIEEITASSPNTDRTNVDFGLYLGGALFSWSIGTYTCTTAGAGQPDPKGCLQIKGDNTATQDGGRNKGGYIDNVIGLALDEWLLKVEGGAASAFVDSVTIANIRSESAGGAPTGDSRDISIDYARNFKILNFRDLSNATVTVGSNSDLVELTTDNNNTTITNSGPMTVVNGLGFQAGIVAAAKPANTWAIGMQVVNDADTPHTIWQKTKHTASVNDWIQLG